jgi:nitrogen fixation protein NifX
MSKPAISKDIALRIALAARVLPDTDVSRLLKVLDSAIGLPPTLTALETLTVKKLKAASEGELSEITSSDLKQALALLKGEGETAEELPPTVAYQEGDMTDSVRVACASNNGELLDGHFGSCNRFLVYQINASEVRLIDIRNIHGAKEAEDKNAFRANLIEDCQVLYVASIGGPAAAKVVRAGVHPIKYPRGGETRDQLSELQKVIAGNPPPWLAKIMGKEAEERVRFERDDETNDQNEDYIEEREEKAGA